MSADLWPAILLLIWHGLLFFVFGRWSVHRTAQYRIGRKIVEDIREVLDRRRLIGDNMDGMVIKNTRGWSAFGYEWKVIVVQEKSVGHRTGSSA